MTEVKNADYWIASPFCSGRYQVNLPTNRKGGTGWLKYDGWEIKALPDYWSGRIEDILDVEKTGNDGGNRFIERRTLIPGKAIVDVTGANFNWETSVSVMQGKGMPYFTNLNFKLGKNDVYIVSGFFQIPGENNRKPHNLKQLEKNKIDDIVKHYRNSFLDNLRDRADNEIPQQQGICLPDGFISDKGNEPFFGKVGVKIKDYRDVYVNLTTGGSLDEDDKPLLKRDAAKSNSALGRILQWAKYSTIRQGARVVNGMTGDEKLIKWQGKRYLFIWEKNDGSVRFSMSFGINDKNSQGSPLSEKEALVAWDTVLPTLKKRI